MSEDKVISYLHGLIEGHRLVLDIQTRAFLELCRVVSEQVEGLETADEQMQNVMIREIEKLQKAVEDGDHDDELKEGLNGVVDYFKGIIKEPRGK